MNIISFKSVDIEKISLPEQKVIDVFGYEIRVKQYLKSSDKRDLIMISIQESIVDKIINPYYLDVNFYVNLIKLYTDNVFIEEDEEDVFELYDKLKITGMLNDIVNAIPDEEFDLLFEMLGLTVEKYESYTLSIAGVVNSLIAQLPKSVNEATDAIQEFDPETLKMIMDIARDTGYKG